VLIVQPSDNRKFLAARVKEIGIAVPSAMSTDVKTPVTRLAV
jgi:hypothetical protein